MNDILGVSSVILGFIGFSFYFRNIFRGHTKPHMFSWLVWAMTTGIAFAGQMVEGAGSGGWVTGATSLLCFSIFILSFKYGEKNITSFDWSSLLVAFMALGLWYFTKEPLLSVLLVTLVDIVGTFPTLRKSYHKPHEETVTLFCIEFIKFIFGIIALETFSLVTFIYPLGAMSTNLALILMILWRRRYIKS